MKKIDGRSKTVRELLNGVKYAIDYYQREYKWETENIAELLDDLEAKFIYSYEEGHERSQVQYYSNYFLGSIVISHKNGENFIIDGQQRLTTLTLLLIYLNNLQKERIDVDIRNLIFSEKFGKKSFNVNVPERTECIETLYQGKPYDATGKSESVRNIVARYSDIEEKFPDSLKNDALPFFIDWLIENVDFVEITAYSDDDAYTIFETMNDRGLSLSPTDMLKGYLLANINDLNDKAAANDLWKQRILQLVEINKNEEVDFFKVWLRAKYADSIRERKKRATNKDFEKIGTEFHKWVREEKERIGLNRSSDFKEFVEDKFTQFSNYYFKVRKASQTFTLGLEYVFYNAKNNFTLQYPLILSPLCPKDDPETVNRKIRLVAGYLDIFIARRVVNSRTLGYSSIVYTMFNLMKEIRDLEVYELAELLKIKVNEMDEKFDNIIDYFTLHQQNRRYVHHILARITHHIEKQSGVESDFETYISNEITKPFEIEHILPDNFERYKDEFEDEDDFIWYRNCLGNLVLLPRGFNQSLGADTYEKKVKAYFGQNLLAKSLNEQCYQNNPSFLSYVTQSGLPFRPHNDFKTEDIEARLELYKVICEEIWSSSRFDKEMYS
jgi:uncharacterized protein with ParB-like and HNH nuclease domain